MLTVKIDGNPFLVDLSDVKVMGDLVELIKATIDPDTIIIAIRLDGRDLVEADWRTPLVVLSSNTLDIDTGSKDKYVEDRLLAAEDFVGRITNEFVKAGNLYLTGDTDRANVGLSSAVQDLQAFVGWYATLLSMNPNAMAQTMVQFNSHIERIHRICEQLLEQQLYQSWYILGQTLQGELEPELDNLRNFCVETAAQP